MTHKLSKQECLVWPARVAARSVERWCYVRMFDAFPGALCRALRRQRRGDLLARSGRSALGLRCRGLARGLVERPGGRRRLLGHRALLVDDTGDGDV